MENKFLAKVAAFGFVVGLLCSGCGSGVTVLALVSPTISQVSPQVVTAGTPNVTVTVQGANFESQAALTVNGTAVPTTVVNSTTIAAKISGSALAQPAVAQLQVRNSNGVTSNQVPLTVTNAVQGGNSLSITTTDLPSGQAGTAYNVTLTAAGGTAPYTWAVTSGSLPAGLTLSSGGVLSGTPTGSGTSAFAITASDASSPQSTKTITFSITVAPVTVAPPALSINSATLGSAQAGATYSATLSATGGTPGYTWSISSGSLPAGLTLSSGGVISGTPTATGTSNFTVAVKDSGSPAQTASVAESVTVAPPGLNITTTALGAGQIGASYSGSLGATGGTPGYTWSILSGNLPTGLTMSSGGVIAGTPTSTGTATFTVAVKDSGSPAQTASVQESITVAPAGLNITTTALGAGQIGASYNGALSVTGGTPSYTWSIASGSLPAGLTLLSDGVISGTPTATGTSTFTVAVKDSGSPAQTASVTESITVTPAALNITTTALGAGQINASYSGSLSASGGTPGYTWSIASGSLPAGLSMSSGGVISGTPTATGTASFTVAVKDSGSPAQTVSSLESITVVPPGLNITTTSLGGGRISSSYSSALSAIGGSPSYTWSISSGSLPAGLTMSSGGVISGTPTSTGTSTFTVAVKDSGSPAQSASSQESITVSAAALTITTTSLGAAQDGSSYNATLSAGGGSPSYTWSMASGALPAGLTMSSDGVISGTPSSTGTSTFMVAVKDSESPAQTATAQESITVSPAALTITTTSLAAGTNGSSYRATLGVSGGSPGYTWSIALGSLPAGLRISSGGVISGTPTSSGTSTFSVAVKDSGSPAQTASQQESITVSPAALAITSTSLAAGTNGSPYTTTLSATGGTPSYTWSISSGSLPAGLTMSSGGGISGTPTATGSSTFTVAVKDSGSQTATAQESITVSPAGLTITTTSLAAATNGSSYDATVSATGGTPSYTWSISSGSLPAGLTLSSGGAILGTPTATGTSTFTVAVKDSGSQTATAQESITVSAAASKLTITSTSLGAAQTGSSYSTTLSATGGAPSYTWSVSAGSLPAGLSMSSTGVISGTPTATASSSFTVMVTDSSSPTQTASAQESISITTPQLTITTSTISTGTSGANYSASLGATGGTPGYTWTVSSGSLPAGLTLSSTGAISGSPTTTGSSSFTITVTDNGSPEQTASAQESITIDSATAPPPPGTAQIYIFPQTPVAVRGAYQTVTALVNGVNDKTVTWTSDGGTIVGTNPCVVNEPCTVALYSSTTGTYHLTATSNANHQVVASSTITYTATPTPRTDHPRFLVTPDELAPLQAKANANDPMYEAIKAIATNFYNNDSSLWTFSTWNGSACTGGSSPSSDQSQNWKEIDAWWMALISLLDPDAATRKQFGCAARDVFVTNAGYVISGQLIVKANRAGGSAMQFGITADYLMGGGFLSASDQAVTRQYLYQIEQSQIAGGYGQVAPIGNYNSPAQFVASNELSASSIRAFGNNYTNGRILMMATAALTFNDNATDDPPLPNTCNATRYQVCPDGTAGSLHAYWTYVTGGMLYQEWAHIDDPTVVQQAYNSAYNNLPSAPSCNALWTAVTGTTVSCLGDGRGGEPSEGYIYGGSLAYLQRAMNAIQTAGYDDPLLYGPQMSLGTSSYWDLHYVSDLALMTGLSGVSSEASRWNFVTDGDSNTNYVYPSNFQAEGSMLSGDSLLGRNDRSTGLAWLLENTAYGMANGQTGGCQFYCGLDTELGNDYASTVALDLFVALPAADPVTNNVPADPRTALPTDWYDAGNQHILTRTGGWTTGANTIFSYYCTNTQIDHEHEFCGGFDLYSNGEYITKGRTEYNDYNDDFSDARNKNMMDLIQSPETTTCASTNTCTFSFWQAAAYGGQFWHGYQAGLNTLYHSELPGYVAAIAEDKNGYNGGWGLFAGYDSVTAASRSLIYLRNSNQVITYDRGATGSNEWDKATYLVSTGNPTFSGNSASWLTRSGNQRVFWTTLEPTTAAPALETTYTDPDAATDWEVYGRLKADAGNVASAQILNVLQWGPSNFSGMSASRVVSSAGTSFDGALVGSSLVMFMQSWPGTLSTMTYPASGATAHYISDLTPNTTYNISASGAPTSATTDNAGVLTFTATGTGNVTISATQ